MAKIRIAAAGFKAGPIKTFGDFADHCTQLVNQAKSDTPDFLVFPELFTTELMTFFDESDLVAKFAQLVTYTDDYRSLFKELSKKNSFHIIAGSHLKEVDGKKFNTSHIFTPDGEIWEQRKCHLFPVETAWTTPGNKLKVFETDKVKFSVLTCYDLEFPEAARLVTLQGADILFSPSATLDEHGYWRVRHCAQARCIEDQVYVLHCSLLGDIGGLTFWGMASILTPCDKGFPQKGIAAESASNEETLISAEVETDMLYEIRKAGAATTLKDRRWDMIDDLYKFESEELSGSKNRV